eukprot:GEMP01065846.1.p1 GENE.GEMP01065846.1~~GEMP01065846.1.p1  ORF type:complete len:273 (+),score=59.50 GEMP01065846.1:23-820(+)
MVLAFVGLGLGDHTDITVKGLETVKQSDYIYLESYTSVFPNLGKAKLEEFYGKDIIEADRDLVESGCEEMLERAKVGVVSFLVVGDPLCATTHTDLFLRAKKLNIEVKVIHNASIMNAVSSTGLQLYRFGETVSIPFWADNWRPTSFVDKIVQNSTQNLHTLCLLDIKVREQTIENMMKNRKVFEPPRFMTVAQAIDQLVEARPELAERRMVGVARLGSSDQIIRVAKASNLRDVDLGGPLHSLIIPAADVHDCEQLFLEQYEGI